MASRYASGTLLCKDGELIVLTVKHMIDERTSAVEVHVPRIGVFSAVPLQISEIDCVILRVLPPYNDQVINALNIPANGLCSTNARGPQHHTLPW